MELSPDVFGYGPAVWSRFSAPRHAGRLEGAVDAQSGTPAGRSVLKLQLRVEGERIADARFLAHGCPVTVAVGEWLCERLAGEAVRALSTISAADIRQALEIPEDKAHCPLMGEDVLRALAKRLSES